MLFSGSGSVEKVLKKEFSGVAILSLDIDPKSAATQIQDIRQFAQTDLFDFPPGYFDVIWASPPCTEYSRALTTRDRDLQAADQLVAATLACILHLRPRYWFVENPDGLLRTRPLMLPFEPYRQQVSYCHYGTPYRKNTCIWTILPDLQMLSCRAATPCSNRKVLGYHPRTAQSGPSGSTPGSGVREKVYAIPEKLLQHMFQQMPQ